jgi:energy-coupling factor transport system permease protein
MSGLARTPRALHPIAWWLWALGLVTAVSRTVNPVLLVLVLAVLGFVIANRRSDAPWARAFKYYLAMALVAIAIRITFRAIFTGAAGPHEHVLFSLPLVHSPRWYAGVRLGGPVSLEGLLAASCYGLQLGTILCCIGAANVLANPKRALRVLPGALYELGVAVVVALTVAPQLVESAQRVRRARRLRAGHRKGLRGLRSIALPVLEDALDRSLQLAAGMDSRGYGRTGALTQSTRRRTAALLLAGMVGLCVGTFGLLDATAPKWLGLPTVAAGAALCAGGLLAGGRRVRRTAYRPDPWRAPEWVVAGGGVLCAAVLISGAGFDVAGLTPSFAPLHWPSLPVVPALAILVAGLAALAAPAPVSHPVINRGQPSPVDDQRLLITAGVGRVTS